MQIDISWRQAVHALLASCVVAAPLALGLGVGHPVARDVVSLGAYLWTMGHLTDKRPIGVPLDVVTALLLGITGGLGALAGRYLWCLVLMAALWAVFTLTGAVLAVGSGLIYDSATVSTEHQSTHEPGQ